MLQSRELNAPARTSLNGGSHRVKVYPVPRHIDARVAQLKLSALGIAIDSLTPDQQAYLDKVD